MLFDPLEEQLDLPARLVERADGGGRQREVVGQEDQRFSGFWVFEANTAQMFGIILAAGDSGQRNGLIANDTRAAIDRS